MKISNIIILLILVVVCICVIKISIINNLTFAEYYKNNFYYNDYNEQVEIMNSLKKKDQTKIALIGSGLVLFLIGVFSYVKNRENLENPIKNLESLKKKSIISSAEFDYKIIEAKKIENEAFLKKQEEKEIKKTIVALENLNNKGILSDEELKEKIDMLNNKDI